ncbi:hypothetical protein EUTSA_v10023894mg, partial [Eutrema salsugineum]
MMFDDQGIKRGHTITLALTLAIREPNISIIVLSKKYASSSWCLDELLEIMKCKEDRGQIVMSIFYEVYPSDVQKQTGEFGSPFNEPCTLKTSKVRQRWCQALTIAGNIAGEHFQNWEIEAKMIEKIAHDVSNKLNATPSKDFDGMVRVESHLREMQSLLDLDYDEVKMVGISDPAGSGKSTISRALQSLLSDSFQLTYFVDNLRGRYPIVRNLEALVNEATWFGPRSRIIVTTKNKELLQRHGINNMYNVRFPSDEESLKILYIMLLDKPLHFGMLTLMVTWHYESVIRRLKTIIDQDIEEVLRVGYDSLHENEQTLFFHISVFFNTEDGNLVKAMLADNNMGIEHSKSLPQRFCLENLIKLKMQGSQREKLWEGTQPLLNLKKINLSYPLDKELPNLLNATNLEILDLTSCLSLVELPSSIVNVHKLEDIMMTSCQKLEVIPTHINLASLKMIH